MAVTPYPFVSGTVLTASQLNSTFNIPTTTKTASHTLIAADAGTRVIMNSASATTITVNTSIFAASDVVEIQNIGAGVCTVTAGTATVSTTGSLALAQNGSGRLVFTAAGTSIFQANGVAATSSGLTLINSTTIGTTVTSVALTNVFSATYDNYRIVLSGGSASATSDGSFILGATTSGYYNVFLYNGLSNFTPQGAGASNSASTGTVFSYSANGINCELSLFSPFASARTTFNYQSMTIATTGNRWNGGGFQDSTTSFTGITFSTQSGHTLTGGTIKVYGLANS